MNYVIYCKLSDMGFTFKVEILIIGKTGTAYYNFG